MSNSAYLEKEIGGVLAEGLAEVVRAQPADPVRHLGKWLQKYVENENLKAQIDAQLKIRSAEVEVLLENERKQKEVEAQRAKAIEDEINRYQSFLSTLKDAKPNSCEEFLQSVVEALPAYVGASDAYAAELAEETRLRYVSATANNKFLVDQSLIRFDPEQNPAGRPNITFQLFQQPEESEEAPAEEFEPEDESPEAVAYREKKAAEAQKKALEVRTVHVPDTLIGPGSEKIHFFRLPQLGAYLCARIYYSSALSEEAIQQAAERDTPPAVEAKEDKKKGDDDEDGGNDEEEEEEEASSKKKKKGKKAKKEEEEEEEEAAPEEELSEEEKEERKKQAEEAERKKREWEALTDEQKAERKAQEEMDRLLKDIPLKTAQYALCLDTLGQNRAFTPQQIERVQEIVRIAQKVLERLDRQLFKVQVEKRIQLLIAPRSVPSAKEEKKVRKELATKVGKKDTAAPEAQFAYRQYLIGTVKSALSDWCNHLFFRGSLPVLQAAMMLVGYPKDALMDPATKQLDWKRMRSFLTAEFVDKVEQYNARLEEVQEAGPEAAKYAAIQEIISGTSYDELKEQNYPLAELFGFVTDALAVKAVAKEEREAAEEEARKRKEEEEEEEKAKADKEKEDDGDKEKEEEEDE